jgi:hypothetical protein
LDEEAPQSRRMDNRLREQIKALEERIARLEQEEQKD